MLAFIVTIEAADDIFPPFLLYFSMTYRDPLVKLKHILTVSNSDILTFDFTVFK